MAPSRKKEFTCLLLSILEEPEEHKYLHCNSECRRHNSNSVIRISFHTVTMSHRPAVAAMHSIACTGHLFKLRLVTRMAFFPSSSVIINGGNFTSVNFQTDSEDSGQSMLSKFLFEIVLQCY